MQYYVTRGGHQAGPFSEEQVRSMIAAGFVLRDDMAWKTGLTEWQTLGALFDDHFPPALPTSRPPLPSIAVSPAPKAGPRGVGGWLLFYCVALTILGPIFSLSRIVKNWEDSIPAFDVYPSIRSAVIVENSGMLALVIYGFITGCQIWSGSMKGHIYARRYLRVRLLGFIAIELLSLVIMSDLPIDLLQKGMGLMLGAVIGETITFTIWTLYFRKSKRVQNTYETRGPNKPVETTPVSAAH